MSTNKTLVTIKKVELKYRELIWSLRIIIPKYLYLKFSEDAAHYKNIRIFDSIMAPIGQIDTPVYLSSFNFNANKNILSF